MRYEHRPCSSRSPGGHGARRGGCVDESNNKKQDKEATDEKAKKENNETKTTSLEEGEALEACVGKKDEC